MNATPQLSKRAQFVQWLRRSWHAPHIIYVAVALVWGVVQLAVLPPFQVPDENSHFFRAWGLAEGQVVCKPGTVVELPENIGTFFNTMQVHIGFPGSYTYADAAAFAHQRLSGTQVGIYDPACAYDPIAYLPAAVGIDIARVVAPTPFHTFYAARLAALLAAVALTAWAIKRIPVGKWLLLLVGLLPMTVQQYASVSADALTISGLLLFVALVLDAATRTRLERRQLVELLVVALVLVPLKPIYLPFLALFLLLRPQQLGGWKRYLTYLSIVGLASILLTVLLYRLFAGAVPLQPSAAINPAAQLATLRANPAAVLRFVQDDILLNGISYLQGMVGVPGWLHFTYGGGFYVLIALGFFAVLTSVREEVRLLGWQRVLLLGVACANVIGLGVFMFVMWTVPGAAHLDGVQGRYFLPMLPLVLLAATNLRLTKLSRTLLVGGLVTLVGALAVGGVRTFYYLEPYQTTVPPHSRVVAQDFARLKLIDVKRGSGDHFTATSNDPQFIVDVHDLVGLSVEFDATGPWELRYRYAGSDTFDEQHVDRIALAATLADHAYAPRHVDLDLTQLEALLGRDVVAVRIDPTDHAEAFRVSRLDSYLP